MNGKTSEVFYVRTRVGTIRLLEKRDYNDIVISRFYEKVNSTLGNRFNINRVIPYNLLNIIAEKGYCEVMYE